MDEDEDYYEDEDEEYDRRREDGRAMPWEYEV